MHFTSKEYRLELVTVGIHEPYHILYRIEAPNLTEHWNSLLKALL